MFGYHGKFLQADLSTRETKTLEDENAPEAALAIKDVQESKVTVISVGCMLPKAILGKSLAVGADELLLLGDDAFRDMDSYAAVLTLPTAITKIGEYDLIFTGMQAADTNAGVAGSSIAEILDIPSMTIARKVELSDARLRVERVVSDSFRQFRRRKLFPPSASN